jgi:hypothetical protein
MNRFQNQTKKYRAFLNKEEKKCSFFKKTPINPFLKE